MYTFQKFKYTARIQRKMPDSYRDTGVNGPLNPLQLFSIYIYQRYKKRANFRFAQLRMF